MIAPPAGERNGTLRVDSAHRFVDKAGIFGGIMMISHLRWVRSAALLLSGAVFWMGCGGEVKVADYEQDDPIARLPVNQTIAIPGLDGSTDVVFDDLGIPHVYAPDIETAIHVQGYLTAQARFWEMDVIRRFAEGRLSELFGSLTLNTDVEMRTMFTTRDGRRLHVALWEHVQQTDPEMARLGRAYAAGVNAWLADLRAGRNDTHLPPEYTLATVIGLNPPIADWLPEDSLAVGRLQALSLSDSSGEDINLARIIQALPEAMVRDIFRSAPAAPTTVLPAMGAGGAWRRAALFPSLEWPSAEVLAGVAERLDDRLGQMPIGSRRSGAGSNNWLVGPSLSASGHALLANDPHLALFNPPVWHMIHLFVRDTNENTTGVIFPGLPGVILGHNDVAAWGATTAGFDVTDVYVEDIETPPNYPAAPRTVLFRGERVPVIRIDEPFLVRGRAQPVIRVIEVVPHHGPQAPDPNPSDSLVGLAASGMSVRWTGHELTNDSRFLFDIARARNVAEFRASLRNFGTGAQNWIWADIEGNIAYSSQVLIPQRPAGAVPYLPMPGTGEAEWLTDARGNTLWLPSDRIPQAVNPASGLLVTANNDQVGVTLDNDPLNDDVYLGFTFAEGFRAQRATELLDNTAGVRPAGAKMTAADMSRYQYDHSAKEGVRFLPWLFAAAERRSDLVTEEMAEALDRLRAWAIAKPGSPPCDTPSGIDAHELRPDVAPRSQPVSAEEKADSIATSIFAGFLTRLSRLTLADDFAGTGIGVPGGADATKALLHILEDIDRDDPGFRVYTKSANGESSLWDMKDTPEVETRDEIFLQALRDGLMYLQESFASAEMEDWLWGLIHQVRFQHFLGQAGVNIFDLGPFAASGFRSTVNPAGFSLNANNLGFSGGPSMRFVVELDPAGIKAVNALPGGNHGDPGGDANDNRYNEINPEIHYGDHVAGWINGETFTYRFRPDEVAANAKRKVRYVGE